MDKCKGGYEYILFIVDHYTCFAQAYATTTKSAKCVADKIFNDYALKFGFPQRIHHDMGAESENQLVAQLNKNCGVMGSRTSPYFPEGNGQVDRMKGTLLQMLKTLTERQKSNWKESLNKLMFTYNSTRSEVTGFSSFYLLFGRSPRLPVDLLFGFTLETGTVDHKEYVKKWKELMQEAYDITTANAKKTANRNKLNYEADRVLLRNMTSRGGTRKLRNHWEDTIHKVICWVGKDMPIYEVRPEQGKGRGSRILHRNLLLPCDNLPLEIQLQSVKSKRKITAQTSKGKVVTHQEEEDGSDVDDFRSYCRPLNQHVPVMESVDADREDINDAKHQPQNMLQQLEAQETGDELNEEETSDQEEIQVQEEPVMNDRMSAPPSPVPSDNGETAQQYQRLVRQRRAPRVFTYDQLDNQRVTLLGFQATSCTGTFQCHSPMERRKQQVHGYLQDSPSCTSLLFRDTK